MRTIAQVAATINAVARINSHVSTVPEAIRPGISIGVQNGMSDMMRVTASAPAEKAITPTVLSLVPRLLEVVKEKLAGAKAQTTPPPTQAQRIDHHHQRTGRHADSRHPGRDPARGRQRQCHQIIHQRPGQILADDGEGASTGTNGVRQVRQLLG